MRVLCDLHHGDLFRSLLLLFEKRLGWQVYKPNGMEWFDEGYWRYLFPARETAVQYLKGYEQFKGVTLAEFLSSDFDFILSSTPPMFKAFSRLPTKAKHIFQMGNWWTVPEGCRNLLNSTTVPHDHIPNAVRYSQEFSLEDYRPSPRRPIIASFMHYNPRPLAPLEAEMSEFRFRDYGAGNRDGQRDDLPAAMREISYLFHAKEVEAYGYNAHYAAACGKPIICRRRLNQHQACGAFLTPETSIDMDDYDSPFTLAKAIARFDQDYEYHSAEMYRAFKAAVDFDRDFENIKLFLERAT